MPPSTHRSRNLVTYPVHYLRPTRLNIVVVPGWGHRTLNNAQLAIQGTQLWYFCLTCITIMNLDTGPWENEHWQGVLKGSSLQSTRIADNNDPVLKAEILNIEQEVALNAGEDGVDVTHEATMSRIRKYMPNVFTKKFCKLGASRWFQFVHRVRRLTVQLSRRFVTITYRMIMMGAKPEQHLRDVQHMMVNLINGRGEAADIENDD